MKVSKFQFIFVALVAVLSFDLKGDYCGHQGSHKGYRNTKPCLNNSNGNKITKKSDCINKKYTATNGNQYYCQWIKGEPHNS